MTDTQTQGQTSGLLTVKTTYARIAIILLALNFCMVGYVIASMQKALDVPEQESATSATSTPTQTQTTTETKEDSQ